MGALMPCTTKGGVMKRNILFLGFLFLVLSVKPAAAVTNGVIVRDTGGLLSLKSTCVLLGCNVLYGLDGAQGQVFLVTQKQSLLGTVLSLTQFIAELLLQQMLDPPAERPLLPRTSLALLNLLAKNIASAKSVSNPMPCSAGFGWFCGLG